MRARPAAAVLLLLTDDIRVGHGVLRASQQGAQSRVSCMWYEWEVFYGIDLCYLLTLKISLTNFKTHVFY